MAKSNADPRVAIRRGRLPTESPIGTDLQMPLTPREVQLILIKGRIDRMNGCPDGINHRFTLGIHGFCRSHLLRQVSDL